MTEIYIISGFLGAGKTTLIQKMLSEAFLGKKVMLIENDFGEVSFDAKVLRKQGYQVQELSAGCICCSLTDDFATALPAAVKDFKPEVLIIEPSGVGKLSRIEEACKDERIVPFAQIRKKITVVDAQRCESYLKNFGEFFKDQVERADVLLLSHMEGGRRNIQKATAVLQKLNPQAAVVADNGDILTIEKILESDSVSRAGKTDVCSTHGHDHDCTCGCHHHEEAPSFESLTVQFEETVKPIQIVESLAKMESGQYGRVLRAKGVVESVDGFYTIQFLPGDFQIAPTNLCGNELCIIGKELDQQRIRSLFQKIQISE